MIKYNFFAWDKEENEETLLFRRMKWDDPRKILTEYSIDNLKDIFFKFYFRFDKKNIAFWKLILGITDEEVESITKGSFRRNCGIWNS
ncbi:hypothetical protein JCM13304A_05450 [Desulfothermus okinawensis JCM 13304]